LHTNEFNGEIFNIGTGEEKSVLEIAEIVLELLEKPLDLIVHIPDRPGHVKRHAVDSRKIRSLLRWKPRFRFEEGMEKTVKWYIDNEKWWKEIKSGDFRKYYEEHYGNLNDRATMA
ncbi:MAG: GDP-mannose 4,6-dehydratase, partial [Methanomassiliicoccales archaeon]